MDAADRERWRALAERTYWVAAVLGGLAVLVGLSVRGASALVYVGFLVVLLLGGGALVVQLVLKRAPGR